MEHEAADRMEDDIAALKASVEKWMGAADHDGAEAVADLATAIHRLGDDLAAVHRRLEAIENGEHQWTTHGWLPPPGADEPPGTDASD